MFLLNTQHPKVRTFFGFCKWDFWKNDIKSRYIAQIGTIKRCKIGGIKSI